MEYTTSVFLCLTISPSTQASSWNFFFVLQSEVLWSYPALLLLFGSAFWGWNSTSFTEWPKSGAAGTQIHKPPPLTVTVDLFLSLNFPCPVSDSARNFNRCYKVQLVPSQLILPKKKSYRNMLLFQNICWCPTDPEKKSQLLSLVCKTIHSMDFINVSKIPLTPWQSLCFSMTAKRLTWQSPSGSCL